MESNEGIKILETAQKNELKTLVETIKDQLEDHFAQKLGDMGIQRKSSAIIPFGELIDFELLDSEEEKFDFQNAATELHSFINQEARVLGDWEESYFWFLDKLVYSFFNRIFAIRIMEELELLEESTLIPLPDLGNRSARLAKIQERHPEKSREEWYVYLLEDVFQELSRDIKGYFNENAPSMKIWPDGEIIEGIIHILNSINPSIYRAEDCIGWFYHYYVLKFRISHKTVSSHGTKSPGNPYLLSILNTVYTPRWIVNFLVTNTLGHWWLEQNPKSEILKKNPFLIQQIPYQLRTKRKKLIDLKILDPACGSGNFLVYAFDLLLKMYKEDTPEMSYSQIIENILSHNLFGIDISRRPAQLTAITLYIMAKRTLKEHAPDEFKTFRMPSTNIVCCDIRTPQSKDKILLLQQVPIFLKKFIKDINELFNNADQLGSLINVQDLKKQLENLKDDEKHRLEYHLSSNDYSKEIFNLTGFIRMIHDITYNQAEQNIGVQIFGKQTRNALTLTQILMNKYDIIVTNPPFGHVIKSTQKYLRKQYPSSYRDLISGFITQSTRLGSDHGYIGMITDFSFLHLPKFEAFRKNVFLTKLYIQYLIYIGQGGLPDAGNFPILLILRNSEIKDDFVGLYRYNSSTGLKAELIKDINKYNGWSPESSLPPVWNHIKQKNFLKLPRSVIDFRISDNFNPLFDFLDKHPRLDISQFSKEEKDGIPDKRHLSRSFSGINTGKDVVFVRYWFEVKANLIRNMEHIESIDEVPKSKEKIYVPCSKGGGDVRFYLNNAYVLWWNKESVKKKREYEYSALRNPHLMAKSHIHYSVVGSKRPRFNISQSKFIKTAVSNGIHLLDDDLDKFTLLAFLNSKLAWFFCILQTKDRKWTAGIIARIPIPMTFLHNNSSQLHALAKESFELRRDWDTGYPMSPIFAETLIDKVINPNETIYDKNIPKTEHPYCDNYRTSESKTAEMIKGIEVTREEATISSILEAVYQRFQLLISRLEEIDEEIETILNELLDNESIEALNNYYCDVIGELKYVSSKDIWLKDFLMANLIEIVKGTKQGVIPVQNLREGEKGLYSQFIDLLSKKFGRDINSIQFILKELESHLKKDLSTWIREDFFFYHCRRFGGRPIVWHFTSRSTNKTDGALDLFVEYHQIKENILPIIRVEYIQPLLRVLKRRKDLGTLPENDYYKIPEINQFLLSCTELEKGYESIPNPNSLTGKKAQTGKGDDKNYEWIFDEARAIIRNGYNPNHVKGVLANLVPLSLEVPEKKRKDFNLEWRYLCPKGTIKQILKKINPLDQLRKS